MPPYAKPTPHIVLLFLDNGLSCGEVIQAVPAVEVQICHWMLGSFAWSGVKTTWGWVDKDATQQARILFDQLDYLDECNDYFLD